MRAVAPEPLRRPATRRHGLQLVETRRPAPKRDLFTWTVGNALAWLLWAAVSVSADHWYWWAAVPLAGWTLVLGLHLVFSERRSSSSSAGRR